MKRFISLATVLLVAGISSGQDSLGINFVRTLPFDKVFYADDQFLIGQHIETGDWEDQSYLVLCNNEDPARPRELWRGLPVTSLHWDFHLYPGVYADAMIQGDIIIAIQMEYCIADLPETYLNVALVFYNWREETLLARRDWSLADSAEFYDYFTLPAQIELFGDTLIASLGCHGLYFFDISNPEDPEELSNISLPTSHFSLIGNRIHFAVAGSYVERDEARYDAIGSTDLSDIRNPDYLYEWHLFHNRPLSSAWRFGEVCSIGNTIITRFRVGFDEGTKLLFANQTNEDWLDSLGLSEESFSEGGLEVVGNQIYISDSDSLLIYELDEPPAMHRINSVADRGDGWFGKIEINGNWIYRMAVDDYSSRESVHLLHKGPVEVQREEPELPNQFILNSAYPNPFNRHTTISYNLPEAVDVQFEVTDINGRSLHAGRIEGVAGRNSISLDAGKLPTGIYVVHLETAGKVQRAKVVCLK